MARTWAVEPIKPHICPHGVVYEPAGEESSQSYKQGAPLVRDASSKEAEVWAGGTDSTALIGFAAADASGTAGTAVPYYEAREGNTFVGSLVSGSGTVELAIGTHVGTAYSLVAQGNNYCVDAGDETTKNVVVTGVAKDAVDGDINAPVIFRVLGDEAANALQS